MGGKAIALQAAAGALFLAASVLATPGGADQRPWRSALVLAVHARANQEAILAELCRVGLREAVGLNSQEAAFTVFDGMESVRLDRLSERLEDGDPRYDAYLKALPGFFFAQAGEEEYRLFYLDEGPLVRRRIKRAMEGAGLEAGPQGWMLVEARSRVSPWLAASALVLMILGFLASDRGAGVKSSTIILAWAPALLISPIPLAVQASASAFLFTRALVAWSSSPYRKTAGLYGMARHIWGMREGRILAVPAAAAVLVSVMTQNWANLLAWGAAILLSPAWAAAADVIEGRRRTRPAFVPLPISWRSAETAFRAGRLWFLPSLTLAFFLVDLPAVGGGTGPDLLSMPLARGYTHESGEEVLPGYGDYSQHMRFQLNFAQRSLTNPETRAFMDYRENGLGLLEGASPRPKVQPKISPPTIGLERYMRAEAGLTAFVRSNWPAGTVRRSPGASAALWGLLPLALLVLARAFPMKRGRGHV